MQRKLIKVGTSAAVLIPKAALDEQRLKIGDTVEIVISGTGFASKKLHADPEVMAWTEKMMKRYEPMLRKLASS